MRIPKYRRHTVRNLGFVEWQGRRTYFAGTWNSTVSREAYLKFIRDNCGEIPESASAPRKLLVAQLVARFLAHAKAIYGPGPRGTFANLYWALTPFAEKHGEYQAVEYGPLKLKAYRASLIEARQARSYINDQVRRIRKAFRWGVSEELVPVSVLTALESVPELAANRSAARETEARQPVPRAYIDAVIPELSKTIADMAEFQWLVGARSDSICRACPGQFTQEGDLLLWRPKHKTEHLGKDLVLPIGPKAQAIVKPRIDAARSPEQPLFAPRASAANERYNATSYRQAIQRAIKRLNRQIAADNEKLPKAKRTPLYPLWSPHQIRHSRGHAVRDTYGIEAAQSVLGHATLSATEIYSATRLELAKRVARETG
jgi:integrase